MIISVINHAKSVIADEDLLNSIRAINRQIKYDFEPYWSLGATLRLEGNTADLPSEGLEGVFPVDLRGDAIVYLWDKIDPGEAVGFHEKHFNGIPYGVVYTKISDRLQENYSVALSHEALELIGDAYANIFVRGPHPDPGENGRNVFHWYELCDAVQSEQYVIEGIEVSNFVLPLYFTSIKEASGRNDFLNRTANGESLKPFGVKNGGYIGYYPIDRPTMNYGWLEQNTSEEEYNRVVLHECGHMLGAIHEHQNPAAGIPWDREAVYRWHEENHTSWDTERINHNYFERYNKNIMNYTNYDDKSIMVYPIPSQFTTTHQSYGNWPDGNSELSETDKQFIKAQYPFSSG